jgi:hypothetical protein
MYLLSPCEFDFLGDLFRDNHQISEIFGFVKLHNKSLSEQEIFQTGQRILLNWFKQGWIQISDRKSNKNKIRNFDDFKELLEKMGNVKNCEIGLTYWIEITPSGEKAYESSKPAESNS